jgi:chromosome segregation ATPase
MTTKQQERDALAKIQKIIADLGNDSYLATTFKGFASEAETNIENDWAMNAYETIDLCREETRTAKTALKEMTERYDGMSRERDIAQRYIDNLEDRDEAKGEAIRALNERLTTVENTNLMLEDINGELNAEIIKLKAKLYDVMTAEVK